MERVFVDSSMIKSIGYSEKDMVLEVEFSKGYVYRYFDVPQNLFDDVMSAKSLGKELTKSVVNGGFSYKRIS